MADTLTLVHSHVRMSDVPVDLVGDTPVIARIRDVVRRGAAGDGGVLLVAEDGLATEPIARELHGQGRYPAGPFVDVDCTDADVTRLERVLFGPPPRVGAPSDLEEVAADSFVAIARRGTLFLRHVSELPAGAQSRLARIARDREVRIAGEPVETAIRIVASASPGIDADVDARRFRADLFRRLSSIRIDVPPLRDRQSDVPSIAGRLLTEASVARGVALREFTGAALALLAAWSWPGNLRELRELVDRVFSSGTDTAVTIEQVLPALRLQRGAEPFAPAGNLREARLQFERDYIAAVLRHCNWHMANAAQTLGIQRPNLYRKVRQLGIPLARITE